jgi:DNA topoisomerase-1
VTLSPEFVGETRNWLRVNAAEALPESSPVYRTKADAQGAHEAIRPTSVDLTPDRAKAMLTPDQLKLYSLIWERAVASQCKPARLSKTKITIACADTKWIARGTVVVDPGYLRFWKNLEDSEELPAVTTGQTLDFMKVDVSSATTKAPPHYSEAKLVQLMERKGIGRPSTYASTIATLKDREYAKVEKGSLVPTALGLATDEALEKAIPDLVDPRFTATMEESLDRIAEGKLKWEEYLVGWNGSYLQPALKKAREALRGVRRVAPPQKPRGGQKSGAGQGTPKAAAGQIVAPKPAPVQPLDQPQENLSLGLDR